ncbi:archaeal proteasome endopeptidase complex subunit alpha [Halosimplex litoreum]|uniref:Proteasome subunit alpha n=1 Tax=Halosimplex litoreum TaxID=1198301 RepID=A0A7T3G0E2_9EURY|nr:archaeal proteasome endopeptidase complex subunit alpha [Halosimplex litoreum]QPV64070.1 archaeal proteasome endopeptidase complex subunit alpha [Halosimplex litoreum]
MQDQNQQAYDRGTSIFSPDGRLYQVEYAREAIKRGTASVGVRTADGVVLAADRQVRSPLVEEESIEKLHRIDDHIAVASAGHVADARQLVDFAREQAQVNKLRYDEPIGVESLAKEVTDYIQRYTQSGGVRPFGVALAIGGVDPDGTPKLFETDPSGTPYEWKATAIGGNREALQSFLEDEYRPEMDLDSGVALALETIAQGEDDEAVDPQAAEVTVIDTETHRVRSLDPDEIASHLDELDGGETDE